MVDHELRLQAYQLCCQHLGGAWCNTTPHELSVIQVSGGVSNLLYCCTLPEPVVSIDDEPRQVLLRLYGDQAKSSDIAIQIEIFNMLSSKGLGPKLYGKFEEGRLEEFLPADSLTCEQLRNHDISMIIAKKLAYVHSLDVPISRKGCWILDKMNEWLDQIDERDEFHLSDLRTSTLEIANNLLAIDYRKEIAFLAKVLEESASPKVFSHNDLHQGNILLAEPSKRRPTLRERVILIDFEYSSHNYRAYDIANHFTEWVFEYGTDQYPHFNYFHDRIPSEKDQRSFIRQYLQQQQELRQQILSNQEETISSSPDNKSKIEQEENYYLRTSINNESNGQSYHNGTRMNGSSTKLQKAKEYWDESEDELFLEVQPFYMAVNLLWALWCIKNAKTTSIKFGYWEHAQTRWDLYSKFKQLYPGRGLFQTNGRSSGGKL